MPGMIDTEGLKHAPDAMAQVQAEQDHLKMYQAETYQTWNPPTVLP
jgi:hypothetical protein